MHHHHIDNVVLHGGGGSHDLVCSKIDRMEDSRRCCRSTGKIEQCPQPIPGALRRTAKESAVWMVGRAASIAHSILR